MPDYRHPLRFMLIQKLYNQQNQITGYRGHGIWETWGNQIQTDVGTNVIELGIVIRQTEVNTVWETRYDSKLLGS